MLGGERLFKIVGIVVGRDRPKVQVYFVVKSLGFERLIWFVVDTGSGFSALGEKDAVLMGIDCSTLPEAKKEAIGFGGFFKPRLLNTQVQLIFSAIDGREYKIPQSGFTVISPPQRIEKREEIVALSPSVLGMDILSKFEIHMYEKKIELIPRESESNPA